MSLALGHFSRPKGVDTGLVSRREREEKTEVLYWHSFLPPYRPANAESLALDLTVLRCCTVDIVSADTHVVCVALALDFTTLQISQC